MYKRFRNCITRTLALLFVGLLVFALPVTAFSEGDDSDAGTYCGRKAHTHGDACFETNGTLVCKIEEHVHSLECYANRKADLENEEIWKESVAGAELNGNWSHDLIEIAKTQLGYHASLENYIVVDGKKKPYTRYGNWYAHGDGYAYGEWCAAFVSFCLSYAGIDSESVPYGFGCVSWAEALQEKGLYHWAADYDPKPGDLIFFCLPDAYRRNQPPAAHVGIVVELTETEIITIEGNNGPVAYHTYPKTDKLIIAYAQLPKNPNAPKEPAKSAPEKPQPAETDEPANTRSTFPIERRMRIER